MTWIQIFSAAVLGTMLVGTAAAQTVLRSSVLPNSRAATVGDPVTVFATMLNSGDAELTNCSVSLAGTGSYTVNYQQTDAANQPVGTVDTPFSIPASSSQSLILTFTPTAEAPGDEVSLTYACDGATAPVIPGVNTVFLSASATPTADIVPILATPSADGVLRFESVGEVRAMGAAAINIGAASDVDVSAVAPFLPNSVRLQVCETDAATGRCLTGRSDTVRVNFAEDQVRTFAVFADAADNTGIPNLPAVSRIYLLFSGVIATGDEVESASALFPPSPPVLGATSAAASAPGPVIEDELVNFLGVYRGLINGEPSTLISHSLAQLIMGSPDLPADGFEASTPFILDGREFYALGVSYGEGRRLNVPSEVNATYRSRQFIRGTLNQFRDTATVFQDFQVIWDPISTEVLYPDDIPQGSWDIRYDGQSIGTMNVNSLGNLSGSVSWPGADGIDPVECDLSGVTGGGGVIGVNVAGIAMNTNPCGPNYFFYGYFEDVGSERRAVGYAGQQGRSDGTLEFMPITMVRQ